MLKRTRSGFTLVEILIVVVILGILAAIAISGFAGVTGETQQAATATELNKVRRHIGVFQARNSQTLPAVLPGDGTWGQIIGRDYLLSPPVNSWVGGTHARTIVYGTGPDTAYQSEYGWIFDPATGDVWAGGYDRDDKPLPR